MLNEKRQGRPKKRWIDAIEFEIKIKMVIVRLKDMRDHKKWKFRNQD